MSGEIERHSSSRRSAATSSPSQVGPPSQSTTRWPSSASARIAAAGSTRSSPATMTVATSSASARRSGSAAAQVIRWVRASSGASANTFAVQSNASDRLTTASGGFGGRPCAPALLLGFLVEPDGSVSLATYRLGTHQHDVRDLAHPAEQRLVRSGGQGADSTTHGRRAVEPGDHVSGHPALVLRLGPVDGEVRTERIRHVGAALELVHPVTIGRDTPAPEGETVKAVVQDRYGDADVLAVRDIEEPVPADDEVLIRVRAAGVDPGAWHLMTGRPYLVRLGFGLRAPKVRVRGRDVSGTVQTVGQGVTRFKPGDDVYGTVEGSFAELACASETRFARKPGSLTFEQAAAVPISGMTALVAVRDRGRVQTGQHVLIIGAGGGVGSFAVQLAKAMGAHVTGVCSTSKVELVRGIGADDVIDYTREDFADGTRQFDVIIDTAGRRPLSRYAARSLTTVSSSSSAAKAEAAGWADSSGSSAHLFRSIGRKQKLIGLMYRETQDLLVALTELIEAGKVAPVIDRTYPLDAGGRRHQVPRAWACRGEGRPHGAARVAATGPNDGQFAAARSHLRSTARAVGMNCPSVGQLSHRRTGR